MIVISPTNLKTYRDCPRKFQAQYITKEIPWKENGATTRGNILHAAMEDGLHHDGKLQYWPTRATPHAECGKCRQLYEAEAEQAKAEGKTPKPVPCSQCEAGQAHAQGFLNSVQLLRIHGWHVQAEMQLATDGLGNVLDWWAKAPINFLRSKIDVCATHPNMDFGIIIDWKSGKMWDDELQLHINAMCVNAMNKLTKYKMMFAYLDTGVVKPHDVVVDIPNPAQFQKMNHLQSPLLPTMVTIDNLKEAYAKDFWPATKQKFCDWCDLKKSGVCTVR